MRGVSGHVLWLPIPSEYAVFTRWESTRFAAFTLLCIQRDHLTYANQENEAGSVCFLAGCHTQTTSAHSLDLHVSSCCFLQYTRDRQGWQYTGYCYPLVTIDTHLLQLHTASYSFCIKVGNGPCMLLCKRKGAENEAIPVVWHRICTQSRLRHCVAKHFKWIFSYILSDLDRHMQFNPTENMEVMQYARTANIQRSYMYHEQHLHIS